MSEEQQLAKQGPREIVVSAGRPAYPVRAQAAFGISPGDWKALVDAVWPAAKTTEAVELALSYCRARKLDPFKRPVHIVPVWDSKLRREVETIWPGIGELRTTASRTGQWAGIDDAEFGPDETRAFKGEVGNTTREKSVTFPAWAQVTVYKLMGGQRVAFKGPKVRWLETYASMGKSDVPNDMWESRPYGQLEKCAEAAALRRAFPEEVGNEYIPEEVGRVHRGGGQEIDVTPQVAGSRTENLVQRLHQHLQGGSAQNSAVVAPVAREVVEEASDYEPGGDLAPEVAQSAKSEPFAPDLSRDELIEQTRQVLRAHGLMEKGREAERAQAIENAFGCPWLVLCKQMGAPELAAGLAALKTTLEGLAALRAEAQRERQPGEDGE